MADAGGARAEPVRIRSEADRRLRHPVHVVWELTLACNLRCAHCGSRAGRPRSDELTTDEIRSIVAELAALGTREISLIGGEAFFAATGSTSSAPSPNPGSNAGFRPAAGR
jgi:MoaA/NifB/PqqE/SkfB family radical SAM enzyme